MKHLLLLLIIPLLLSCSTVYDKNELDMDNYFREELCLPCQDSLLLGYESLSYDSLSKLSLEERILYAELRNNCETCIASRRVSYEIRDRPNAATPLWLTIVATIVVVIAGSR